MELRYRAEDRYAHPIISERVAVQNIVIKLDRNRESQTIENVDIVGVVEGVHRFRGACLVYLLGLMVDMADFQCHPLPDSRFARMFEEAFPTMNCTYRSNVAGVDCRREIKGICILD